MFADDPLPMASAVLVLCKCFNNIPMLFPTLKNKKFGYVNLDLEARKWIAEKKADQKSNPLLDPKVCQEMVNDVNRKYGLDFSYGGWMEDRSFLWRGSYLDEKKIYIHLGIDLSVPAGTPVAATFDAEVVKIDDDYPEVGGWGTRVILKHKTELLYFIFAHLDRKAECNAGDMLKRGGIFAKAGKPPFNGNWFEHLHLQAITEEYYREIEEKNLWDELDGYGSEKDIKLNAKRFPDPIKFIF